MIVQFFRIIPAPAGNTSQTRSTIGGISDHPRACGEHSGTTDTKHPPRGSSPRLRGTPRSDIGYNTRNRIIPAPAGNTCASAREKVKRSDHPRACGEHFGQFVELLPTHGSSPRLRGTRVGWLGVMGSRRIIPAPAGNTPDQAAQARLGPDHPRACGEHFWPGQRTQGMFGSSPRLRGTRIHT